MSLKLVDNFLRSNDHPTSDPDVLMAEANHRIANNLALVAGMVRLQASSIAKAGDSLTAQEVCGLLAEVGNRVETVGRLHRLLAEAGRSPDLELSAYLREIAHSVVSSLGSEEKTRLVFDLQPACSVPSHHALPIGLVVGELATNALKYAHPSGVGGVITLGCARDARDHLVISVQDDGVGLPEDFDPRTSGGLGMRLVRSLAQQLDAQLAFAQTDLGLAVSLRLPPPGPRQVAA